MANREQDELWGYKPKGAYLDTGMSAADKAKVDDLSRQYAEYQAVGDQEGMNRVHQEAEGIRAGYGYSGGADGSEYQAKPKADAGSGAVGTWNGGKFTYKSAPEHVSKYQGMIDELTRQIMGRAAFEYDPESDPAYQQYKESYTRNGRRAMEDTLGQVSARTGGLASSYAASAAQQTYDGYMSALADKVPELRQLAYQMYRDEGADQRANLEMLLALEQGDYNKYTTLLGQYNNDRTFDYGVFSDRQSFDFQRDQEAYRRGQAARENEQWQKQFDYGVEKDKRADERSKEEWEYKKEQDALSRGDQERQDAVSRIYSYLQAGGATAELSPELVARSGLSEVELAALEADITHQRQRSDEQYQAELTALKAKQTEGGNKGEKPETDDDAAAPVSTPVKSSLDWENRDIYTPELNTVTMDLTGYAADLFNDYAAGAMSDEELAERIKEEYKEDGSGRLKLNEVNEIFRRLGL